MPWAVVENLFHCQIAGKPRYWGCRNKQEFNHGQRQQQSSQGSEEAQETQAFARASGVASRILIPIGEPPRGIGGAELGDASNRGFRTGHGWRSFSGSAASGAASWRDAVTRRSDRASADDHPDGRKADLQWKSGWATGVGTGSLRDRTGCHRWGTGRAASGGSRGGGRGVGHGVRFQAFGGEEVSGGGTRRAQSHS